MITNKLAAGRHEFSLNFNSTKFLYNNFGEKIWKIHLFKGEKLYKAAIEYVYNAASTFWQFDAEIELKIKNQRGKMITNRMGQEFDYKSTWLPFGRVLKLEDFFTRHCRFKRKFKLVVDIRIGKIDGIGEDEVTNFKIPKNIHSEVIFLVGDQRLYLDKYALLCFSPVFREILESEEYNGEIVIKNFNFESVVAFLRLLYQEKQQLTENNINDILEFCSKYDVQCLLNECEEYLCTTKKITLNEKLLLAELYNLPGARQKILIEEEKMRNCANGKTKRNFERIDEMDILFFYTFLLFAFIMTQVFKLLIRYLFKLN